MHPLLREPLLQIWFLKAAEFDASVDVFECVPESRIGCRERVAGKKAFYVVTRLGGAKTARVGHQIRSRVRGELRFTASQWVLMKFHVWSRFSGICRPMANSSAAS